MSTPLRGFTGPAYQYTNQYAAVEDCVNWYPTVNEQLGEEQFQYSLDPSPVIQPFSTLPVPSTYQHDVRGMIAWNPFGGGEKLYGVSGNIFWVMSSTGVQTTLGTLSSGSAGIPVVLLPNANGQLLIIDGSNYVQCYVYNFNTSAFTTITSSAGFLGATNGCFQDGYALVLTNQSQQFQISGNASPGPPVGDFTQWSAGNISILEGQADPLLNIISSREYVRIFGAKRSQVYYNAGAAGIGGFPFQSYNSTFIETGLEAVWSAEDLGDSLMWLGSDARGIRACWRDFGFQPQRVSTFAIEQIWATYPAGVLQTAVACSYIWKGHLFYQITFPVNGAASFNGATWVYDATVSQLVGKNVWHRRTYLGGGTFGRPELYHAYCYGLHLVAGGNPFSGGSSPDGNVGAVYQYYDGTPTVAGLNYADCYSPGGGVQDQVANVPIRVVPHISGSQNRFQLSRVRVNAQVGLGPGTAYLDLNVSSDSGNTYGPTHTASLGSPGTYNQYVQFHPTCYFRGDLGVLKFSGQGQIVPFSLVSATYDGQELGA
jgi:hypothetical protein